VDVPENDLPENIEAGLEKAMLAMAEIQSRLEAGGEVDEKELTMLSRMVATHIENVRAALEDAVGPIDPDYMREEMRKQLSPEEFEDWLATEEERRKFREELSKEKPIAEQLGDDPLL
jgi:hypothetical protein